VQTILGGEAAVNFLQNVFGCVPDLSLTCHTISSVSGNDCPSTLLINDVIIDAVQTLRELSSVCMDDESKESHLQLLRDGFDGLRAAIFPRQTEHRGGPSHLLLPKELISLCNTEMYGYLDSVSRSKSPTADDIYCNSILIFPTILSRTDISQHGNDLLFKNILFVCMYCIYCVCADLPLYLVSVIYAIEASIFILALYQLPSLSRSI